MCVKIALREKQTKQTKKKDSRGAQLLEIVHINICKPFDIPYFSEKQWFITFTDHVNISMVTT